MKMFRLLPVIVGALFCGMANGADITLYYSPTCPHCHHAREFLNTQLIAEYPRVTIEEVNVMMGDENLSRFRDAVKKCKYNSGGVPVMVIGEKCFQGYADFMQSQIRDAVKVVLPADNANAGNKNAATNNVAAQSDMAMPRTTSGMGGIYLMYGLLVLLAVALAFTFVGRGRKK